MAYSRDDVVQAVTDLADTIWRMAGEPQDGQPWRGRQTPNPIDSSLLAELNKRKTSECVDLIAHLPRFTLPLQLAPESEAIDFLSGDSSFSRHMAWNPLKWGLADLATVEPHELPLTTLPDEVGFWLIVDTESGMAHLHASMPEHCPIHSSDAEQPSICYHQADTIRPAVDILREWKENFLSTRWMVGPLGVSDIVFVESGHWDYECVREVYQSYGWPSSFDAQGCRTALENMRLSHQKRVDSVGEAANAE